MRSYKSITSLPYSSLKSVHEQTLLDFEMLNKKSRVSLKDRSKWKKTINKRLTYQHQKTST